MQINKHSESLKGLRLDLYGFYLAILPQARRNKKNSGGAESLSKNVGQLGQQTKKIVQLNRLTLIWVGVLGVYFVVWGRGQFKLLSV